MIAFNWLHHGIGVAVGVVLGWTATHIYYRFDWKRGKRRAIKAGTYGAGTRDVPNLHPPASDN